MTNSVYPKSKAPPDIISLPLFCAVSLSVIFFLSLRSVCLIM